MIAGLGIAVLWSRRGPLTSTEAKPPTAPESPGALLDQLRQQVELRPRNGAAHYLLARALAQGGEFVEALEHLEVCRHLGLKTVALHHNFGICLLQLSDAGGAVRELEAAATAAPNELAHALALSSAYVALADPERGAAALRPWRNRARRSPHPAEQIQESRQLTVAFGQLGDYAAAYPFASNLTRLTPSDAGAWASLGKLELQMGNFRSSPLRRAVELDPKQADFRQLFATALLKRNPPQAQAALDELKKCLALNREHGRAYFTLGQVHQQRREWKLAAAAYLAAIHHGTERTQAPRLISECRARAGNAADRERYAGLHRLRTGEPVPAERHFKRLLQLEPRAVDGYLHLADALTQQNRIDDALVTLRRAQVVVPQEADLDRFLAHLFNLKQSHQKEEAALERFARRVPERAHLALRELGALHLTRGDYARALDCFRRCVQAQPDNPDYRYAFAKTLLESPGASRQIDEALKHLGTALQLRPEGKTHHLRGVALSLRRQWTEAAHELRRALELDPTLSEAYYKLLEVNVRLKRPALNDWLKRRGQQLRALRDSQTRLAHAARARPRDVAAQWALADTYWQLNRREEAERYLRRVLKLDPRHRPALRRLAQLLATSDRLEEGAATRRMLKPPFHITSLDQLTP